VSGRLAAIGLCGALLLLGGCARTTSSAILSTASPAPALPPTRLLLALDDSALAQDPDHADRARIDAEMQRRMIDGLRQPEIQVIALPPNTLVVAGSARTLLIRCKVTTFRAGNQALRLTVGFGAGRVELGLATQVIDLRGPMAVPVAHFDSRSTTGRMPGPGLGLFGAVGTGQVLGMAGGAAGLLAGSQVTLTAQDKRLSTLVVAQLHIYFREQGWVALAPPDPAVFPQADSLAAPRPL
jgi:hypothetical protein